MQAGARTALAAGNNRTGEGRSRDADSSAGI